MCLLHHDITTNEQVFNILPFTPTNIQRIKNPILYFAL